MDITYIIDKSNEEKKRQKNHPQSKYVGFDYGNELLLSNLGYENVPWIGALASRLYGKNAQLDVIGYCIATIAISQKDNRATTLAIYEKGKKIIENEIVRGNAKFFHQQVASIIEKMHVKKPNSIGLSIILCWIEIYELNKRNRLPVPILHEIKAAKDFFKWFDEKNFPLSVQRQVKRSGQHKIKWNKAMCNYAVEVAKYQEEYDQKTPIVPWRDIPLTASQILRIYKTIFPDSQDRMSLQTICKVCRDNGLELQRDERAGRRKKQSTV